MLQSFIIYGFMMVSMMFIANISRKREILAIESNYANSFLSWDIFLLLFIFSFFSGVRYNVGVDYPIYFENYNFLLNGGSISNPYEPIFMFVSDVFTKLKLHYSFYFGFIAFTQIFFLLFAFKNQRYLYTFIIFVLFTNGTFFILMNGIRQSIVLLVFMFMLKYVEQRKFIPFLIGVFVTYFVHKSSILLIPIYFLLIFKKEYFKKVYFQYILIISAALLSSSNIWNYFLDFIEKVILLFGYEESYGDIDRVMMIFEQDYSKGIRFYFPLLLNIFITFFYSKMKDYFKSTNFVTIYNLYFFGAIFNFLFYNNSLFRRPAMYFMYFNIVITAYLLYYLWINIKLNKLYFPFFFIAILLLIGIFYAFIASDNYTQFSFFWQNSK